ncbi:MAG: SDR family NAD(P)-dependent oxidoreductase [Dehalococcoidia bacterium]|nr:SDR family NAD(P)-dependent oxidoreductase [Dehalococcoidia bacterium]
MDDFQGKVAVITGGASGLGFATAKVLAKEGMRIVIADIEQGALDRAVPELQALGAEVLGVRTDVGVREDLVRLADATWERFGGCHILFNNAGVAVEGPIQEMTHQDWEWSMRVNLWGPIHGVEAFVPRMIAQDEGGHVINTASFAGLVANDGLGVYCVTKYGVVALSECLYRDLRPHNIGVSVLCPMRVLTNIDASARNRPAELGGGDVPIPEPNSSTQLSGAPLVGNTLQADDVAGMVLDAVKNRRLYILTHPESRGFVQSRFRRIDRTYDDQPWTSGG